MNDLPKPSDGELEEAEEYFQELLAPPGFRSFKGYFSLEVIEKYLKEAIIEDILKAVSEENKKDSTS